jgi:pimeloyl-ACP methyl ester carboxylesterase
MILYKDYPFPVGKFIDTDGVQMAYVDVGKGEQTMVFVHGFASNLPVWSKNIEVLRKYHRCLALDLPGHGLSSKGMFDYSMDFYVEKVKNWLAKFENKKVILIGHSMGGQICIWLALQYPDLFSHLVLVSPAGFEVFTEAEKLWLKQFTTSGIIGSSQYLKLILNLKNYFYHLTEKEYKKLNEFSRDFYSLEENPLLPVILSKSIQGMVDKPVLNELPKLQIPVIVFFGKEDKLIPNRFIHPNQTIVEIAQQGFALIPAGQLKLYEDCGHFLQYEYPAKFNIDVYKFLNPHIFG